MSWEKRGDVCWLQGDVDGAIRAYERARDEDVPRVLIYLALLYLITGKSRKAADMLATVKRWNTFDFTVREIEKRAEEIFSGKLKVVRFPSVVGWFYEDDALPAHEYTKAFEKMSLWVKQIPQIAGRRAWTPVLLAEIVSTLTPFSRGGVLLRSILPKVEIAVSFLDEGTMIHEITHVLYPSVNLFLTEGLALFFQEKLAKESKGWPFTVSGFSQWQGDKGLVEEMVEESLFAPRFFNDEHLATGEAMGYYKLAWEWVSFLVEKGGMDKFMDLYEATSYGDISVREMLIRLYGMGNVWLVPPSSRVSFSQHREETQEVSQEEELIELEKNWKEKKDTDVLARLCRRGFQFVNYLRGCTFEEREKHPLFGLFTKYLEKEKSWLKEALKHWPDDPGFHCLLADLYGLEIELLPEEKRMANALLMQSEVKKALSLDPDFLDAWVTLGRILLFTPKIFGGGITRARECFAKVLAKDSAHADALAWDGYADWMEGKKEAALEKWEKVLSVCPGHLLASQMRAKGG